MDTITSSELLNEAERGSMFWELAVGYLEGIATDSRRYAELTPLALCVGRLQGRPDSVSHMRHKIGTRLQSVLHRETTFNRALTCRFDAGRSRARWTMPGARETVCLVLGDLLARRSAGGAHGH